MELLANATVIIILQYTCVWNQHIIHLKLTQCYMPLISQLKKKKKKMKRILLAGSLEKQSFPGHLPTRGQQPKHSNIKEL